MIFRLTCMLVVAVALVAVQWQPSEAQTPPNATEAAAFTGLHKAVHENDLDAVRKLLAEGADPNERDARQRTPAHVAAFASNEEALALLAQAGADLDALEYQLYDVVTIAAVADDPEFLKAALEHGASAGNTTSVYDGTALIAAAHLGHHEVVEILIAAGAPLDHVNNLGWTALIEAVVLGDGGPDHVKTAAALVRAGADKTIADRNGRTPLELATERGYRAMVDVLN